MRKTHFLSLTCKLAHAAQYRPAGRPYLTCRFTAPRQASRLAAGGLLRPGEILSKTDPIRHSDISFELDRDGRLVSATMMITPIKRYHKHLGDKSKCPVVIKAHRGGALRMAELLEILNMIVPCRPGGRRRLPS